MKPSKLVESGWPTMSYFRSTYLNNEILAAAYGPYESRNSQKSDYTKLIIEVTLSDTSISIDHSQTELLLSQLFSSVINIEKYPYLSFMICIQIFTKDQFYLSACINAAYQAVVKANIEIKNKVIAKDFCGEGERVTLAIVPKTEFVLFSLCERPLKPETYREFVMQLASESELRVDS